MLVAMPALLQILYLIIEIATFLLVAQWIGLGWALLALVAFFVVGVGLAAFELRRITVRAMRANPQDPAAALGDAGKLAADSALIVVGCLALALPGFVTSVFGLLLIFPPTRALIRVISSAALLAWLHRLGRNSLVVVQEYGVSQPRGRANRAGAYDDSVIDSSEIDAENLRADGAQYPEQSQRNQGDADWSPRELGEDRDQK